MALEDTNDEASAVSVTPISPVAGGSLDAGLSDDRLSDDVAGRLEELAEMDRTIGRFDGHDYILTVTTAGHYRIVLATQMGGTNWSFMFDKSSGIVGNLEKVDIQTINRFFGRNGGYEVRA